MQLYSEMACKFIKQNLLSLWALYNAALYFQKSTYITNSIELSWSWEAASCAATEEFPNILRNPMVHCRVHTSPPPVPTLSKINSGHTIPY
jgi:hypothetical protein